MKDILDQHAPLKKSRPRKHSAPWIHHDLRKMMVKRNRLHRQFLKSRSPSVFAVFKSFRNRVTSLQKAAKRLYLHSLVQRKAHPSAIWSAIKLATSNGSPRSLAPAAGVPSATELNVHFAAATSVKPPTTPTITTVERPPATTTEVLSLQPVSSSNCSDFITHLSHRKAPGTDQINSSILKLSCPAICGPLASIINSSIATSTYPVQWKSALVCPLHKGGSSSNCNNYRPISLLPTTSKVCERLVNLQLSQHLGNNNLLHPLQSGFRPGHSTESLLLYLTDSWYKSLDKGKMIGVVFLDISKAFDTIDHNILLRKLREEFCVSEPSCQWIQSYLRNREQAVRFNGTLSSWCSVKAGVPQGSVLGPTLFSMYINDLPESIAPADSVLFADDTTIYTSGTSVGEINAKLNSAMSRISSWMSMNGLTLNASKTKVMLIHSPRKHVPPLNVTYNDSPLEQVEVFKLLGVLIDHHLKWDHHVNHVVVKVSRNLRLMRRLSWILPRQALVSFYFAYIVPSLDYCNLVWSSCRKSDQLRLQRLQNYAARIILKLPKMSSASEARNSLHWTSLEERHDAKLLGLVKILVNQDSTCSPRLPSYLSDLVCPLSKRHNHTTRGALTNRLALPTARTEYGRKAPSFKLSKLWNSSL